MTVNIGLTPDVEAGLSREAHEKGVLLAQLVSSVLQDHVGVFSAQRKLSGEEKAARWIETSKKFPHTPRLSDEQISRESMYEDRL